MKGLFAARRVRALGAVAAACLLAACDDDPSQPTVEELTANVGITPDTLGTQEAIRIVFNRPVSAATALDPSNFVVTNLCDTLRVPGALRLSGDTLIFSPASPLPFLTRLSVRVQNILDLNGLALRNPIAFSRITRRPPVSDLTWSFLNSPTSEDLTGVSFVNDNDGYLLGFNGTLYRTTNGGAIYAAIFKSIDITDTYNVRALTVDSLFMVGGINVLGTQRWALFRSVNGGLAFDTVRTFGVQLNTLALRRVGTGRPVALFGGNGIDFVPALFRYDGATGAITRSNGVPGIFGLILIGSDLSADTSRALAAFTNFGAFPVRGLALRSTDGGRNFTQITLPANTAALNGANFINATDGFLLGDSSTVLRVNASTGAVTPLGSAQGIPQTARDTLVRTVTSYQFFRAAFAPDGQIGWIVGQETITRPNAPDAVRGVILQSRDGGASFTRQAIAGATANGLGFPPVLDVQARAATFAALSGSSGLVAARKGNPPPVAAACSFSNPG